MAGRPREFDRALALAKARDGIPAERLLALIQPAMAPLALAMM